MNLSQIKYFLEAVELSSIHKVAEKNNISPQGASKSIRALEDELGGKLIDRSTKGVVITEFGQRLKPFFEKIMENEREIKKIVENECNQTASIVSGAINLVVTPRFADTYLGGVLKKFKKSYPEVHLKVDSMSNDKIFRCMQEDTSTFDLAIVTVANIEPDIKSLSKYLMDEKMQFISYCTKELYICGRKEMLKEYGTVFDIDQEANIIAYEYGGILENHSYPCAFKIDSISTQRDFINQYDIIGAYSLDEYAQHFNQKKHAYIPMNMPITLTYGSLMRYSHVITEAEKVFLQTIFDYFVEEK